MRLGGYVIHGNNADTLPRCLDALVAVSDEVVAVDSCSTDGSADAVRARGIRQVVHPWEGYGAARCEAVRALEGCDYVFFLDSDEWLEPEAIEALRAWKRSAPDAPRYSFVRRHWAELPTGRFLFRTERHVHLVRRDAAGWLPGMIVHEELPPARTVALPIPLEHRFATEVGGQRPKYDRYALLCALQLHLEGRRPKPAPLRWLSSLVYLVREGILKGSLFRGGAAGWALAGDVAWYHARKHVHLAALRRGAHAELVQALREGRRADVFRLLPG
jgi:glycosyltransferase involved in cell wall biosynthesis